MSIEKLVQEPDNYDYMCVQAHAVKAPYDGRRALPREADYVGVTAKDSTQLCQEAGGALAFLKPESGITHYVGPQLVKPWNCCHRLWHGCWVA